MLWRYGFDDASGNFQVNNYGRGGTGGDYVRAEAADGSGTNNANFNTPAADGNPPRMQMYLWPGNQLGRQNQVVVAGVGEFGAGWARFGPPATTAGTSGQIRLVTGSGRNASRACGRLDSLPAGAIAVVDAGGSCDFLEKVHNAEAAGASAVIVADDQTGTPPPARRSSAARSSRRRRRSRPSASRRRTAPRSRPRCRRRAPSASTPTTRASATVTWRTGSSSTSTATASRTASPAA